MIRNIKKQKSSTLDNLMVGDLRYCIVLLFIMCTLSGNSSKMDAESLINSNHPIFEKMKPGKNDASSSGD